MCSLIILDVKEGIWFLFCLLCMERWWVNMLDIFVSFVYGGWINLKIVLEWLFLMLILKLGVGLWVEFLFIDFEVSLFCWELWLWKSVGVLFFKVCWKVERVMYVRKVIIVWGIKLIRWWWWFWIVLVVWILVWNLFFMGIFGF